VTLESLVKSACETWAGEGSVPAGLADRALRRRSRQRSFRVALAAGSTALLIGAAAVLLSLIGNGPSSPDRSGKGMPGPAHESARMSSDTSLRADPGHAFPRHLIAAGHTALAAYWTPRSASSDAGHELERHWFLYDPASDSYRSTGWAFLDVAPGLHQAAVLEKLPTSRVGLLDLATWKITRWVPVEKPVGGVAWAPDGLRLALTTYSGQPDRMDRPSSRTGFYVLEPGSRLGPFRALPADHDDRNVRQDLAWSRSGNLLWAPRTTIWPRTFYTLEGARRPAPPFEMIWSDEAGLSPDGTLTTGSVPDPGTSSSSPSRASPGPSVTVTDVRTGTPVADLRVEQARTWADDRSLIAVACDPRACTGKGEFRNRLVLAGLDGRITPLTGYRDSQSDGWELLLTHR
jgi:hypothetical protein